MGANHTDRNKIYRELFEYCDFEEFDYDSDSGLVGQLFDGTYYEIELDWNTSEYIYTCCPQPGLEICFVAETDEDAEIELMRWKYTGEAMKIYRSPYWFYKRGKKLRHQLTYFDKEFRNFCDCDEKGEYHQLYQERADALIGEFETADVELIIE